MTVLEEPIKEVLTLKNYINGEWVEAKTDEIRDVVNPATMKIIARVPRSGAEDVDDAIQAAHEAFPKWRRTPSCHKGKISFQA